MGFFCQYFEASLRNANGYKNLRFRQSQGDSMHSFIYTYLSTYLFHNKDISCPSYCNCNLHFQHFIVGRGTYLRSGSIFKTISQKNPQISISYSCFDQKYIYIKAVSSRIQHWYSGIKNLKNNGVVPLLYCTIVSICNLLYAANNICKALGDWRKREQP